MSFEFFIPIECIWIVNCYNLIPGNSFNCDCHLLWMLTLRNETKSGPLRSALSAVTCTFDYKKDTRSQLDIQEPDVVNSKVEDVIELDTKSGHLQQNDEDLYEDNPLYKLVVTERPVEMPLVDIPSESLPCPGEELHKGEDSLMLSSKDQSLWQQNLSPSWRKISTASLLFSLVMFVIFHI